MRIWPLSGGAHAARGIEGQQPMTSVNNQGLARASAAYKVTYSGLARLAASVREVISSLPETRTERIAQLQDALSSGRFSANPDTIADVILAEIRNQAL